MERFYVDLHALAGVLHLLIGLGNVFGVRQLDRHLSPVPQKTIQTGDGSAVTAFAELDPEHHETCVRASAPHVIDELDLLRFVLVWMMLRTV